MMNKKPVIIFILIILSLGIIDVLLLIKFNAAKKDKILLDNRLKLISYLGFSKFDRQSLDGWDDREIKLQSGNSVMTILIFFRTNDCPICLKSLVRWNKVKADYSDSVHIIAVSPEKDREYYKELIELYNLKYDLAIDDNCTLFRYLTPEIYTPVFVYLNNKNEVIGFDIFETLPKTPDLLNKHIGDYIKIALIR